MTTGEKRQPRSRPGTEPERRRTPERRNQRPAARRDPATPPRRSFDRRSENRPELLRGLDVSAMDTLLSYFHPLHCLPGTLLVREGAADSSLYLIRSGEFEVLVNSGAEKQRAGILSAGDVFGEVSFFDGEPRSADIRTFAEGEVLVLSPSAFNLLSAADPQLAIDFLLRVGRVTAGRFRAHNRRLASLGLIAPALPW